MRTLFGSEKKANAFGSKDDEDVVEGGAVVAALVVGGAIGDTDQSSLERKFKEISRPVVAALVVTPFVVGDHTRMKSIVIRAGQTFVESGYLQKESE